MDHPFDFPHPTTLAPPPAAALDVAIQRRQGSFTLDVAFAASGGVTALFGPSGSGKSSVIQAVAGLTRPESGHVRVGETVFFDSARKINLPAAARRCGYVFQDGRLFPHLSVADNLRFGLRRSGLPSSPAQWTQIVEMLGIGALLQRRPHHLSGGEKQRVAIGRALLMQPRLLLLDEPLAALDTARKAEILPYLETLRRSSGVPILYVSHAADEVLRLADRVVLLAAGKVAAAGAVTEIFARPDLAELTGDGEPGAALEGTVLDQDPVWGMATIGFAGGVLRLPDLPLPVGTPIVLRLRARDIALARTRPSADLSSCNVLAGTVCTIRPLSPSQSTAQVDVSFTVGPVRLYARVTREALSRLAVAPGQEIFAVIKAVAISPRP